MGNRVSSLEDKEEKLDHSVNVRDKLKTWMEHGSALRHHEKSSLVCTSIGGK